MIRLILAFLLLIFSAYAGIQLKQHPGYVLISVNGWTIETTLWFAIFALLIIFVLLHAFLSLMHKPALWKNSYRQYQEKKRLQKELDILREKEYQTLKKNLSLTTLQELQKTGAPEAVEAFYNNLPKKLRNTELLQLGYLDFLMDSHQMQRAEKILRKKLRKDPTDKSLIERYGKCHFHQKQIIFAESLLKENDSSATLYLCLGRLCMDWQLWGKAKHYLEKSLTLHATAEGYEALGRLYEAIDDQENAYMNYKEGLKLIHDY